MDITAGKYWVGEIDVAHGGQEKQVNDKTKSHAYGAEKEYYNGQGIISPNQTNQTRKERKDRQIYCAYLAAAQVVKDEEKEMDKNHMVIIDGQIICPNGAIAISARHWWWPQTQSNEKNNVKRRHAVSGIYTLVSCKKSQKGTSNEW